MLTINHNIFSAESNNGIPVKDLASIGLNYNAEDIALNIYQRHKDKTRILLGYNSFNYNEMIEEYQFKIGLILIELLKLNCGIVFYTTHTLPILGVRYGVKQFKINPDEVKIFHKSNELTHQIYLTDKGKIYQKNDEGKMLSFVPLTFCAEWSSAMIKLF